MLFRQEICHVIRGGTSSTSKTGIQYTGVDPIANISTPQADSHAANFSRSGVKGLERPRRLRTPIRVNRDVVRVLADVDPGAVPGHHLQDLGLPFSLAWHVVPSVGNLAHKSPKYC